MKGTFACVPIVCPDCAQIGLEIQRKTHHSAWPEAIGKIADDQQRECVREYLRGIYQRARAALDAKREAA